MVISEWPCLARRFTRVWTSLLSLPLGLRPKELPVSLKLALRSTLREAVLYSSYTEVCELHLHFFINTQHPFPDPLMLSCFKEPSCMMDKRTVVEAKTVFQSSIDLDAKTRAQYYNNWAEHYEKVGVLLILLQYNSFTVFWCLKY